jgi:hypothetical protein
MPSSIISPFPVFNDLDGSPLENGYIFIGQSNLNPETAPVNVFWDAARTIPAAQPIRTIGGFPSRNGSPSNVYVEADTYSITVRNSRRVFVYSAFDQSDAPSSVFDISTQVITATAGQTTFTLTTFTYLPGTDTLQVYRNGLRLTSVTDYLESNTSTVTMTSPAALGDEFLFQGGAVITGNQTPGTAVSFIQAGTGAITRNMQDKVRESVSVLDFGADPTGNTDSTAAFQAALAASRQVFVPSGTYLANITITQSGSKLIGDSEESTTIKNWSNSAVVTIDNSGGSIRNVQIENIYFRNRNKLSYPLADGLVINGVNGSNECDFHQVINCTFFQFRYGIYLKNRTIWNRWVQVNVVESIIDGVNVEATDNIAVQYWETCRIAANGRYGIFVNHTFANFLLTAWTFVNCNLENNISVPVRVTGTYGIQNWSFIGCYSEENATSNPIGVPKSGFIFLDSPYCFGLDFKNCTMMGNASVSDPDYYIYISDATVNNSGSVDLCRFDTAGVKSVYWNRNVGLGRNINMSATYNRTLGSTNIEDVINLLNWTPTLEIGGASTGITYSNQIGKYTVVGRVVNFECYISLTNKGSLTGNVAIAGLPVTSSDITNLRASVSVGPDGISPGSYSDISGVVLTNSTKIEIVGLVAGTRTALTNSQLGNFSNFLITGSYVF